MKKTLLFEPYTLKGVTFKNRVAMAPMCQYSAGKDGLVGDWHHLHYGTRAVGQVGMIIIEATAVEPKGRISEKDLGLWSDEAIAPFAELLRLIKMHDCRAGIQIAHAGRKSTVGNEHIVAPSSIAFASDYQLPRELSRGEIAGIISAFGQAVRRAVAAGVDFVEIHGAHGYLINQFLSPLTNKRTDDYGRNRSLFLWQVLEEAKAHTPRDMPLFLRVSAEEYMPDGNHPEDVCQLIEPVRQLIDLVHVSSGGVVAEAVVQMTPGYQVAFAQTIKKMLQLPVMAVGMLESPARAEETLQQGQADFVALGRELLRNPYWPLHAARTLEEDIEWPTAYQRAKISRK